MVKIIDWLGKSLHQSYIVMGVAIGVIFGMVVGLALRVNYFGSWWWMVGVVVILVVSYLKPKMTWILLAVVAGMVLAFFRVAMELEGQEYVRGLVGSEVMVQGTVTGDPEADDGAIKLKLSGLEFDGESVRGSIYVTARAGPEVRRSDIVVLVGKMLDGFGTYAGYMYQPKIVKVMHPEPGDVVLAIRDWFAIRVQEAVPEREAKLGLSYLMGMKTGLDDALSESLRMVGLTHIVVASGAHLAILVEVAKKLFGRLSRAFGLLMSVIFVVFFMAMVGWTPSIMRAGVMTILTLICWYVGRKIAPWRLILMVAAGTLMYEPMFLMNLGWQLSFASFAGIMMLGPGLTKFFYGVRKPGLIGSTILTTLAATVMTLPITLYHYGVVSLISVVANLLILPTLSCAMGLVFLAGLVGPVPGLGGAAGFIAMRMLDFWTRPSC